MKKISLIAMVSFLIAMSACSGNRNNDRNHDRDRNQMNEDPYTAPPIERMDRADTVGNDSLHDRRNGDPMQKVK